MEGGGAKSGGRSDARGLAHLRAGGGLGSDLPNGAGASRRREVAAIASEERSAASQVDGAGKL